MTVIFDSSDGQELRFNSIGSWLKKEFGRKIVKLSLDAGFTCPNRDGSKGKGGCLFCSDSGSGDHASRDIHEQIRLLSSKWPDAGYIAYFQSHTNTYAPPSELLRIYGSIPDRDDVVGIAIATRPDCLSTEILDLLSELNDRTFLWVELGLQSIHEETMRDMNLCYTLKDYDRAVAELARRNIRTVTHLILGLPGESRDMMLESVRYVCRPLPDQTGGQGDDARLFGIKLHMLNIVCDSDMPDRYPGYVPFDTIDDYSDLAVDALEIIPPQITIHRIYADAPGQTLIAPSWARRKRLVLNDINRKLRDRDTWQGRKLQV